MDIEALAPATPAEAPAPAPATEETSAVASIIPVADRDRWLSTLEVQAYLGLTPAEYLKLISDGSIPHDGAGLANRLHPREALRDLLVDRLGEGEAKRAWSRLEDRWAAEDEAYGKSGPGAVEAFQRKAAGLPPLPGYQRRADPLEGRQKPAASPETKPEAPRRAYWADAHDAMQAAARAIAENNAQQRRDQFTQLQSRTKQLSTAGLKRSTMSAADKARFLDAHGREAYFKLPA